VASGAKVGFDEFRDKKTKFQASLDALEDAKRERMFAQGKDLLAADADIRAAKVTALKDMNAFHEAINVEEKVKNPDALLKVYSEGLTHANTNATQVAIANANNQTRAAIYQGIGGIGSKPMTQAQLEAAVSKEADRILKTPGELLGANGKPITRDEARRRATATVMQGMRGGATVPAPAGAGWNKMVIEPD
jgi:hypothetical protein